MSTFPRIMNWWIDVTMDRFTAAWRKFEEDGYDEYPNGSDAFAVLRWAYCLVWLAVTLVIVVPLVCLWSLLF